MGLISKTVNVRLSKDIIKWYENKGYYIPRYFDKRGRFLVKRGTNIEIKTKDLMNNSNVHVNVKCDCEDCKNPYLKPMSWQNYKKNVHEDGKYYCRECATKLFGKEKTMKTKLLKSKSFEQWCIENNRQDVLDRWDYELNEESPNEVTYASGKKYYFKCPRGIHKSELNSIGNYTRGEEGIMCCNQCNSFGQWMLDNLGNDAIEKYWSDKNTLNPFKIAKKKNKPKIFIKCQNSDYHEDYTISAADFVEGSRCPYCTNRHGKVHPLDSLGQYVVNNFSEDFLNSIWSDKNDKSAFEYSPKSNVRVYWRCIDKKHEDYFRMITKSNEADFRCPDCVSERDESFLQEKVRLYLESLNIGEILHEYNCTIVPKNPKTKQNLPFDNEIKELKLIIEVHGQQHYKICGFHKMNSKRNNTTTKQELHYQQLKDRYKRIYAKIKGYYYLEISYKTDNVKETWKQLIDNKIKEIINKRRDDGGRFE